MLADATGFDIDAAKRDLRRQAAERRRHALASRDAAAVGARDRFVAQVHVEPAMAASAYWPLNDEFDPRPLVMELLRRGHPIGLPVVVGKGQPLRFRRWQLGMDLVQGAFRVMTPPPESPEIVPDLLLVPLLAFDRAGYRLGYGGGFYDRTIAKLRGERSVVAVGVAFAAQEVPSVPCDATDQPLDWIVTEREAIRIAGR